MRYFLVGYTGRTKHYFESVSGLAELIFEDMPSLDDLKDKLKGELDSVYITSIAEFSAEDMHKLMKTNKLK